MLIERHGDQPNQFLHDGTLAMLVITRKLSEEIVINGDISVQVVDIRPGRVKLGVKAPSWMLVQRGEHVDEEKNNAETSPVSDEDESAP